jgi:hypothetical protein
MRVSRGIAKARPKANTVAQNISPVRIPEELVTGMVMPKVSQNNLLNGQNANSCLHV